ncbi:hypothetical protein HY385_00530 [Candidatus Daviesbacteria bacterium]|nr:hypothetical protein [Candidatus Daviesbacteria bacterium]
MPERLPFGVRKHIRRELAQVRRNGSPVEIRNTEQAIERERKSAQQLVKDKGRLAEINYLLQKSPATPTADTVALMIEWLWYRYKLESPSSKETRKQNIKLYLDSLESSSPELYSQFVESKRDPKTGQDTNRLIEIRNKVIPDFRG